jgi:hypothetical protein
MPDSESKKSSKKTTSKPDPKEFFSDVGNKIGSFAKKTAEKVGDSFNQTRIKMEEKAKEKRKFNSAVREEFQRIQQDQKDGGNGEEVWHDLTIKAPDPEHIGLMTPIQKPINKSESKNPPKPTTEKLKPDLSLSPEAKLLKRMTPEMQSVYNEAQSSLNEGQESFAIHYFEYLLELAKKANLKDVVVFIEKRLNEL